MFHTAMYLITDFSALLNYQHSVPLQSALTEPKQKVKNIIPRFSYFFIKGCKILDVVERIWAWQS